MKNLGKVVLGGGLFIGGAVVGVKGFEMTFKAMLKDKKFMEEHAWPLIATKLESLKEQIGEEDYVKIFRILSKAAKEKENE